MTFLEFIKSRDDAARTLKGTTSHINGAYNKPPEHVHCRCHASPHCDSVIEMVESADGVWRCEDDFLYYKSGLVRFTKTQYILPKGGLI